MYKINLFEKFGERLIWGHDMGEEYREKILSEWKNSGQDILNIDFNGISIIDYSASSDIICIPISRLAGELEGKLQENEGKFYVDLEYEKNKEEEEN